MTPFAKFMRGFTLLVVYECVILLAYSLVLVVMDIVGALITAPFYGTPNLPAHRFVQYCLLVLAMPPVAALVEYLILRRQRNFSHAAALRVRIQVMLAAIVPLTVGLILIELVPSPLLLAAVGQGIGIFIFLLIYSRFYRTRLAVMIVTTVLMIGVLEFATRRMFPQPIFNTRLPYYPNVEINRTVNLKGVKADSHYSTNTWGFRGDPVPADRELTFEILTIGGSTTLCFFLDDANTYPTLMQNYLREDYPQVWVGNAGLDGHTTRGHLVTMETVVSSVKPDGIVFLIGINDLSASLSPGWQLQFDEILTPWFFDSALFRLLWRQSQVLKGGTTVKAEGHGNFVALPMTDDEVDLPADLAEALPTLPEYRVNVNRLIDLGQQQGIQMLFMTQPLLFEDNEYWAGINSSSYWLKVQKTISGATNRRMMDLFNATLLEICDERGVPCYDLAAELSGKPEYFYDSMHFTDEGAARVGELAAQAIEELWVIE